MTAQKCGRCESLRKIIHRRWIAASTRALASQAAIISTMKCFRRMAKAVVSAATCVPKWTVKGKARWPLASEFVTPLGRLSA